LTLNLLTLEEYDSDELSFEDDTASGVQEAPCTPVSMTTAPQQKKRGGRPKPKIIIQGQGSEEVTIPSSEGVKVFANETAYQKYLHRRTNNNVAATKSRQKKRIVESSNQVRVVELERENADLKRDLEKLRQEVASLGGVIDKFLGRS